MKVPSFPLMLLMVVLLLNACKEDEASIIVNTLEVSDIGSHSATLNGEVASNEAPVTGRGFFWSETNPNPDKIDNLFILADLSTDFSAELTRLEPGIKYYVRAYATDIKNVFHGQVVEFTTTSLSLSTVTTENITNITQTTATGGGNIISDGGATITARGVCWNTTGNPTIADNKTTDGSETGSWVSELTELQPNTTYYVSAYATNSMGTAYGEQIVFITTDGKDTQTAVVDVTNPATGKTWMDRNLGASRAATSSADEEAYGDLYQWGRATDGHQKRNSFTTSSRSSTNNPGHGYFITAIRHPDDWRSPQNTDLWQGESGTNNPCPSGYRLPTIAEWNAERLSWSSNNAAGAFASPLKLPVAGDRWRDYGVLHSVGSNGYYWSSNVDGSYSRLLYFSSSSTVTNFGSRAYGYSIRCLKD